MLKLKVRSFIGCERADIDIDRITIVAGKNKQGKSSVLDAASAALTGQVMPTGIPKGEAGRLVLKGEAEATVKVIDDTTEGVISLTYPKAERITDGSVPQISKMAAGLIDYMGLKEQERAKLLAPYIDAVPTLDDVTAALQDINITGEFVTKVWGSISENGWDHAHTRAVEVGQKLKGQWEEITGDNYGSKKARKWLPENWDEDLDGESLEALEGAVTDAARTADAVIASTAVDAERVAQLRNTAEDLVPADEACTAAKSLKVGLAQELEEAQAALNSSPRPQTKAPMPCPYCGEPIKLTEIPGGHQIDKADAPQSDDERKRLNLAINDAKGVVKDIQEKVDANRTAIEDAQSRFGKAQEASSKLLNVGEPKDGASPEAVAETKEAKALAEQRRDAFSAKGKASRKAKAIEQNQAVVALLAADGLRKTVLLRHLDNFANASLVPLSEAAGWGRVTFRGDLSLDYNGSPRPSGSEDYATQTIIQVALAKLEDAAVVILDGSEIFDGDGALGLVRLLRKGGIPALVGMMVWKVGSAPDLQERGLGRTYYMEKGLCQAA